MYGEDSNLILVCGCPRSGTTLIQRILNAHPEVYGGPEFDFLPEIAGLRDKMRTSIEQGRLTPWLDKDALDRAFASFIHELLQKKEKQSSCRYVSEKTPSNVLAFPSLINILPNARFVFVVRDPRAIIASMLQVARNAKNAGLVPDASFSNVLNATNYINQCWKSGFSIPESTNRFSTIFYEDVIRCPETAVRKMCESIGLPFCIEMLSIENCKFDLAEEHTWRHCYSKKDLENQIHQESREKWRDSLTNADLFIIHKHLFRNSVIENRYFAKGMWQNRDSLRGRVIDRYLSTRATTRRLILSCWRRFSRHF